MLVSVDISEIGSKRLIDNIALFAPLASDDFAKAISNSPAISDAEGIVIAAVSSRLMLRNTIRTVKGIRVVVVFDSACVDWSC
jgi:hypothetical protein